ncbi:MAG: hypothetical protein ABR928_06825 [Terracidiphilus sp.]|jgi:hypothetical protein
MLVECVSKSSGEFAAEDAAARALEQRSVEVGIERAGVSSVPKNAPVFCNAYIVADPEIMPVFES